MTQEERKAIKSAKEFAYTEDGCVSAREIKTLLNLIDNSICKDEITKIRDKYTIIKGGKYYFSYGGMWNFIEQIFKLLEDEDIIC